MGITTKQLARLDNYLSPDAFLSLSQHVPDKDDGSRAETFQDRLCDENPSPEDNCATKEEESIRQKLVQKILSRLSKKERVILTKRKMSDKPVTFKELAKEFTISRERIRQIETRALGKLRKALQGFTLRDAVDIRLQ